jgi:hypothetical protein
VLVQVDQTGKLVDVTADVGIDPGEERFQLGDPSARGFQ